MIPPDLAATLDHLAELYQEADVLCARARETPGPDKYHLALRVVAVCRSIDLGLDAAGLEPMGRPLGPECSRRRDDSPPDRVSAPRRFRHPAAQHRHELGDAGHRARPGGDPAMSPDRERGDGR
jgi:hypothetical protein